MRRLNRFFSLLLLLPALVILSGCGEPEAIPYKVELEVWGVFDDSDVLSGLFDSYQKINPYVQVKYRKMTPETYRTDLLEAFAAGKGPDVFMLQNTWRSGFEDKIVPAPALFVNEKKFRETFVDVVADDFLGSDGQIYAAPLSVDSLALYYNKDIFNTLGIAELPKTWEELLGLVRKMTEIDRYGNINRSAISLGTGDNINRSVDVLLLLMLQMGADFQDERFFTTGAAQKAFEFYNRFARLDSTFYTWSPREHYSIDAFYEGTLGMTINYSYHYPTFRQKNAKFNFAVAPLPQFSGEQPINFANYWGFAVAKNKAYTPSRSDTTPLTAEQYQQVRTHEAWQLIHYLAFPHPGNSLTLYNALGPTSAAFALKSDPALDYLKLTRKPAARRDLIETQKDDLALAPFALGNLVARSWKPGNNTEAVESLLVDAINSVNRGERTIGEALSVFEARRNQFR
ncbi:MAG: extracellular solute-binding protein [Candidatus Moraniibacteriota bacterium]|nr:MAG: extracellular solute-binding protein [Candidatus Moranbacteria bacterium]